MHDVRKITDDLYFIGASDRRLALFENVYPIPDGVSYNSYILLDEKTVVLDTVDSAVSGRFFENIAHALNGRKLDYLVVNHMEPDHCAAIEELVARYPELTIVCNAKVVTMIKQFFNFDIDARVKIVAEGDTLNTGKHELTFVMAPMVHWPEVMVTYDSTSKVLFSADAFGTFGALGGSIFAHDYDFDSEILSEARRYYTNIVGKYGTQVLAILKKAAGLDIEIICPLHGPIFTQNINKFINKYISWASYKPEVEGVVIAYASVYGNTENTVEILAGKLYENGVTDVKIFDVSKTHPSYILSEAFKYSHLVVASTTYNAGIFPNMETFLSDLVAHNLQNRTIAVIENGSWAPTSKKLMLDMLCELKSTTILDDSITIKSAPKKDTLLQLEDMAKAIASTMKSASTTENTALQDTKINENAIDATALFNLPYGLYLLVAKSGDKDNACVINTVLQLTDTPKRLCVCVAKANYTHDMIMDTKVFNVLALSQSVSYKTIQQFGFNTGRDTDKFKNTKELRTQNGLRYIDSEINTIISANVIKCEDMGTHTLFIADITYATKTDDTETVTYSYYQKNVKPQPQTVEGQKGYVCKICGWVYEGETLPEDIICPLCKHGADAFEKTE